MTRLQPALGIAMLVVLATLAAGAAAEVAIGRGAMQAADAALANGNVTVAIDSAREAAGARILGSPYTERGYALLAAVAREAETRGDDRTAGRAFRAMRAAALATRTFERMPAWASTANAGLVRIAGRAPTATAMANPAGVAAQTAAALAEDDAPAGSSFLAVGLLGVVLLGTFIAVATKQVRA